MDKDISNQTNSACAGTINDKQILSVDTSVDNVCDQINLEKESYTASSQDTNEDVSNSEIAMEIEVNDVLEIFPFICGFCNEKYNRINSYFEHLSSHDEVTEEFFHLCLDRDDDRETEHSEANIYVCGLCSKAFQTICQLHEHMVSTEKVKKYVYDHSSNTAQQSSKAQLARLGISKTVTLETGVNRTSKLSSKSSTKTKETISKASRRSGIKAGKTSTNTMCVNGSGRHSEIASEARKESTRPMKRVKCQQEEGNPANDIKETKNTADDIELELSLTDDDRVINERYEELLRKRERKRQKSLEYWHKHKEQKNAERRLKHQLKKRKFEAASVSSSGVAEDSSANCSSDKEDSRVNQGTVNEVTKNPVETKNSSMNYKKMKVGVIKDTDENCVTDSTINSQNNENELERAVRVIKDQAKEVEEEANGTNGAETSHDDKETRLWDTDEEDCFKPILEKESVKRKKARDNWNKNKESRNAARRLKYQIEKNKKELEVLDVTGAPEVDEGLVEPAIAGDTASPPSETEIYMVPCTVCGKKLTKKNMNRHMSSQHNEKPPVTLKVYKWEDDIDSAKPLKKLFANRKRALEYWHKHKEKRNEQRRMMYKVNQLKKAGIIVGTSDKEPSVAPEDLKSVELPSTRMTPCSTCGIMMQRRYLSKHEKTHHNIDPHATNEAGEPLDRNKQKAPCSICGKFVRRYMVKQHELTHSGVKRFHCEICQKGFHDKNHLKQHMVSHAPEKNFVCDICGKHLKTKATLIEHTKTHSDVRDVQCPMCPEKFRTKKILKYHLLTHSDDKAYHCDVCGKDFRRSDQLLNHKASHVDTRQFGCDSCGKTFKTRKQCMKHIRTMHAPASHTCQHCGKGFARVERLRSHMLTHSVKEEVVEEEEAEQEMRVVGLQDLAVTVYTVVTDEA